VPSGAIHQQHSMGTSLDGSADLFQVQLHGMGVGIGKSQSGTSATGRADGAEQVGVLVALIGWLTRPCSPLCPLPNDAVLLANARLVLPPDLDGLVARQMPGMCLQRAREVFLYSAITLVS
jgi:hypothetical protein